MGSGRLYIKVCFVHSVALSKEDRLNGRAAFSGFSSLTTTTKTSNHIKSRRGKKDVVGNEFLFVASPLSFLFSHALFAPTEITKGNKADFFPLLVSKQQ